jgi:hypothetical protein
MAGVEAPHLTVSEAGPYHLAALQFLQAGAVAFAFFSTAASCDI